MLTSSPASSPSDGALSSETAPAATCPASPGVRRFAKRLGILGFTFFLLKGILWLVIPAWFVGKGCAL